MVVIQLIFLNNHLMEVTVTINVSRHVDVFSPTEFGNKRIDIIGAGATGSKVVVELAKLGIKNIHAWDFDKVEPHNIPNQVFGMDNVGQYKTKALKNIIKKSTGLEITTYEKPADGTNSFGDIVFLLTDSIESRKKIFEGSVKYKNTRLMVETRMGADNGRIYSIDPRNARHIKEWESTLKPIKEKTTVCGTAITVGATASMLASMAVWQFIKWSNLKNIEENEIIFGLRPTVVMSRKFQ